MKILLVTFLLISMIGCKDENTDTSVNVPTDTSIEFPVFPKNYFLGTYSESYTLTGEFSNSESVTIEMSTATGSVTEFDSQTVFSIKETIVLENHSSGSQEISVFENYYSSDAENLKIVGAYSYTEGVIMLPNSNNILPSIGSIGDSGEIGKYTFSSGLSNVVTWEIKDGFNGNAFILITFSYKDSQDNLLTWQ